MIRRAAQADPPALRALADATEMFAAAKLSAFAAEMDAVAAAGFYRPRRLWAALGPEGSHLGADYHAPEAMAEGYADGLDELVFRKRL